MKTAQKEIEDGALEDQDDTATGQGMPAAPGNWKKQGKVEETIRSPTP